MKTQATPRTHISFLSSPRAVALLNLESDGYDVTLTDLGAVRRVRLSLESAATLATDITEALTVECIDWTPAEESTLQHVRGQIESGLRMATMSNARRK